MAKVKKFKNPHIRQIGGGKDPLKVVNEFILKRGCDPDECLKESDNDLKRWMLSLEGRGELEILTEGISRPPEATIYMGINVATVPLRGAQDMLVSALEIADGLVGVKVSLVGHYLVLSASLALGGLSVEDLDYYFRLIEAQCGWFQAALLAEMSWEDLPES